MAERMSIPVQADRAGRIFLDAVKHVHDYAIFLIDPDGIIVWWNEAARVMKGYTIQEALGSSFGMLYTLEDQQAGRPHHHLKLAAQHGTYQEEAWRRRKNGELFWAMIELIAIKSDAGDLVGYCKITRDITGTKELQDQLATEKERAQVTLAAIGEAVVAVDPDGKVEYLNPRAEQLTGWENAEAKGNPMSAVFHVIDEQSVHPSPGQLIDRLSNGHDLSPASSAVLARKDGSIVAIEDTAAPIRLPNGRIVGGVIVFRDVSDSRQLFRTITHQAAHDSLTGLVNRLEFERCLQRSLERALHSGKPGALLFMDLDQFKIINDRCGHEAGDQLLIQIGSLYRSQIRERDVLARIGGDEFALIAEGCSEAEAHAIADKILESTRNFQFIRGEQIFNVGVSIGVATFDGSVQDIRDIVRQADHACSIAKQSGRNRLVLSSSLDIGAPLESSNTDWPGRLADALQQGKLELCCQSIQLVGVSTGKVNCEILLRLIDPVQGLILPGAFIPAAERHDLMPKIDRWVVEHVLKWLDEHGGSIDQLELCSVNLSAKTLADDSFLDYLTGLLNRFRTVPTSKLCFEISAQAASIDMQKSIARMNGLRSIGCKVAIGGVGTGAPSFAHLRQFPADFIKIDASRATKITRNAIDECILVAVNEIAHLMGQKTIAEYVEDQATVDALTQIGIDYMQGRWIAPPQKLETLFVGIQ